MAKKEKAGVVSGEATKKINKALVLVHGGRECLANEEIIKVDDDLAVVELGARVTGYNPKTKMARVTK